MLIDAMHWCIIDTAPIQLWLMHDAIYGARYVISKASMVHDKY